MTRYVPFIGVLLVAIGLFTAVLAVRPAYPAEPACAESLLFKNGEPLTSKGWRMKEIDLPIADGLIKSVNAAPPVTEYRPERVFLFGHPEYPDRMGVVFVVGECVIYADMIPIADFTRMLEGPGRAS